MNTLNRYNRVRKDLDEVLAALVAKPPVKVAFRVPGTLLDHFIGAGIRRCGSGFKGFAYGVAEGKIHVGTETDTVTLYRASFVGTFGDDFEALDPLLGELGILQQFLTLKAGTNGGLRDLLIIDEERAWQMLRKHYYVTDDDDGTHVYRRDPQQLTHK